MLRYSTTAGLHDAMMKVVAGRALALIGYCRRRAASMVQRGCCPILRTRTILHFRTARQLGRGLPPWCQYGESDTLSRTARAGLSTESAVLLMDRGCPTTAALWSLLRLPGAFEDDAPHQLTLAGDHCLGLEPSAVNEKRSLLRPSYSTGGISSGRTRPH